MKMTFTEAKQILSKCAGDRHLSIAYTECAYIEDEPCQMYIAFPGGEFFKGATFEDCVRKMDYYFESITNLSDPIGPEVLDNIEC